MLKIGHDANDVSRASVMAGIHILLSLIFHRQNSGGIKAENNIQTHKEFLFHERCLIVINLTLCTFDPIQIAEKTTKFRKLVPVTGHSE